jgi:hypothetical protein
LLNGGLDFTDINMGKLYVTTKMCTVLGNRQNVSCNFISPHIAELIVLEPSLDEIIIKNETLLISTHKFNSSLTKQNK